MCSESSDLLRVPIAEHNTVNLPKLPDLANLPPPIACEILSMIFLVLRDLCEKLLEIFGVLHVALSPAQLLGQSEGDAIRVLLVGPPPEAAAALQNGLWGGFTCDLHTEEERLARAHM